MHYLCIGRIEVLGNIYKAKYSDPMKINELFSENIKRLRLKRGLTQQKLADLSGFTVHSLRDYETGRRVPSLENMGQIASALGVKVSDLFESDEPAPVLQMPVSKTIQKLAAVPDEVYELAQGLKHEDEAWEYVKAALESAREKAKLIDLFKKS
jgi:transcriptional regulator with XRE-family HTH domain